jgi:1-acyl-sn-glycerol-3-phosphate acyltransferase
MRILKEIFGRIWALWAALLFVTTMLIFLLFFIPFGYFQKDPLKTRRFCSWSRVWMAVFLNLGGFPLHIKGKENFEKGKNYIVLCNHNSFMDVPVSYPAIPGGNKTIAKIEMARVPLFGMIYRIGSILVDRKSDASKKESFNKMKAVLAMGLHMCIYPEGTRNRSVQPLKAFHSGAFRLSVETGKPVIPALIFNTRKVLPPNKIFFALPHRLEIHFLPPVSPDESADKLRTRVWEIMRDYYERNK